MFLIDYLKKNTDVIKSQSKCQIYNKGDVLSAIDKSISVRNSNIVDYMKATKESWALTDLHCPKSPFPYVWLEHDILDDPRMPINKFGIKTNGTLILTNNGNEKVNDAIAVCFSGTKDLRNKYFEIYQTGVNFWSYDKIGNIVKRYYHNSLIENIKRKMGMGNEEGELLSIYDYDINLNKLSDEKRKLLKDRPSIMRDSLGIIMISNLMTFSFMNCKNVSAQSIRDGSYSTISDAGNYERRPFTKIYTLVIDPMKKVISNTTGISGNLTPKAFHICRGHFRDFSHGKGLFGKYKGTYWFPMHTRGNRQFGEVIKDYKVLTNGK